MIWRLQAQLHWTPSSKVAGVCLADLSIKWLAMYSDCNTKLLSARGGMPFCNKSINSSCYPIDWNTNHHQSSTVDLSQVKTRRNGLPNQIPSAGYSKRVTMRRSANIYWINPSNTDELVVKGLSIILCRLVRYFAPRSPSQKKVRRGHIDYHMTSFSYVGLRWLQAHPMPVKVFLEQLNGSASFHHRKLRMVCAASNTQTTT